MKADYQRPKSEWLNKTSMETGLTEKQAQEALREHGANRLTEQKKKSVLSVFVSQFADLLVIILIAAAVISMVSGNTESAAVILAVILMNAVLGTVQYVKAQKSLDALKALSSPHAKVLRDGAKREIPAEQVAVGDILLLEAGDLIAADARILEHASLQVNESSLTGESTNVDKSDEDIGEERALGDRFNMVYAGTLVTYGRASAVVTATGMRTEMGHIADLLNATKEKKTPLQVSLDAFSKKLAVGILGICAVVFALRLWQAWPFDGGWEMPVLDSLMFAVALAVAAIPEALSSIVTIVQAMGTRKMAQDNAIMKELKAVESLGCVSVICSDKTGTLTQNKMTVQELYADGRCMRASGADADMASQRHLLFAAVLNNDSSVDNGTVIGDPTEACLLPMALKAGLSRLGWSVDSLRRAYPRTAELPFDSDRKLMSSAYDIDGQALVYVKGAPDVLLSRCVSIAIGNDVRPMTEHDRAAILAQNNDFSGNGLRVLAFGYKAASGALTAETERDFVFLGLVSMADPPRKESIQAVADAKAAGIRTVMITGDHAVTAKAIAKQIGICDDDALAVTGMELDGMSDEELDAQLERIAVYARVSPENKIRIVDAWQRRGCVVSMTGDGVNDAPALKKADIGVAMGITGTEVSKDAASMILSDDNFATIIKAVEGGRSVYRNILGAVQFLLSGNLAAILAVLVCTLAALPTPFQPVHLLFINLLTDSLPALAIGMEPSDRSLLLQPPRDVKQGIFTKAFATGLLSYGAMIAAVTMAAFFLGNRVDAATASTMAFATLTLARLFHGFNCRHARSLAAVGLRSNRWSVGAFAVGVLLLAAVLFLPFLQGIFMVSPVSAVQTLWIVLLAATPTAVVQITRMIREIRRSV